MKKFLNVFTVMIITALFAASMFLVSCGGSDDPVQPSTVAVTSVSLNKTTLTMLEGDKDQLVATVSPSNATDKTVTWSSSTASVASVDNNGNVTASKAGTTTITAKAGGKSATCSVTVSSSTIAVTGVTLDKTTLALEVGGSETLTATVKPDNASNKMVAWSTDKEAIAKVDANGKVTAVAEGDATITATAGDKSATCKVTVSKATVAVTGVTLNKTSIEITVGSSETLVATVKPDDATDKTVTWESNKTAVATVDAEGKVTAITEGDATITAKAGSKSATCSVKVSKVVIAVTSVTLNKTTLSLTEGKSETLTATVKPDDATDKTVTWSSDNEATAVVDANGKVTAVAPDKGGATITAKAGEKSATCKVTVNKEVIAATAITVTPESATLMEGMSVTFTAALTPENSTYTVNWPTDDTYLTADGNGKYTVKGLSSDYRLVNLTVATNEAKTVSKKVSLNLYSINFTSAAYGTAFTSTTVSPGVTADIYFKKGSNVEAISTDILPEGGYSVTSSDESILTVARAVKSISGTDYPYIILTGVAAGKSTVTVTIGEVSKTLEVKVSIPATGISVSPSTTSFMEGQTKKLTATLTPSNTTQTDLTWGVPPSSSYSTDGKGTYTAKTTNTTPVYSGSYSVYVTDNPDIKTSFKLERYMIQFANYSAGSTNAFTSLTVGNGVVTNIAFKKGGESAYIAKSAGLIESFDDYSVKSSNADIVSVAKARFGTEEYWGFQISSNSGGTANVTVTIGDVSRTLSVTVSIPATGISVSPNSTAMVEGQSKTITATLSPSNTTQTSLMWTTLEAYCTYNLVSSNVMTYTAKSWSASTPYLKTASGSVSVKDNSAITSSFNLVIYKIRLMNVASFSDQDISSCSLSVGSTKSLCFQRGTEKYPLATTTISKDDFTVTSSNTNVATVSTSGTTYSGIQFTYFTIAAKGGGTATVTVKVGSVTKTVAVTVSIPATGISVSPNSFAMVEGQSKTITATLSPSNTTQTSLMWSPMSDYCTYSVVSSNKITYTAKSWSASTPYDKPISGSVYLKDDTSIKATFSGYIYKVRIMEVLNKYQNVTSLSLSKNGSQTLAFEHDADKYPLSTATISSSDFTISSSDSNVAAVSYYSGTEGSVSYTGIKVLGKAAGTATVTIKVGSVTKTVTVTVK